MVLGGDFEIRVRADKARSVIETDSRISHLGRLLAFHVFISVSIKPYTPKHGAKVQNEASLT